MANGDIIDDYGERVAAAADSQIIGTQLRNLEIQRQARAYQRVTGDKLAYDAFVAANGDPAKAQNFLAYGQMVNRATVKPADVTDKDVMAFAQNYYEQEAGRKLTPAESARLEQNLSDKTLRNNFKSIIAERQTATNLQQLNSETVTDSKVLADKVNPKALQNLNTANNKFSTEVQDSGRQATNQLQTVFPQLEDALKSNKIPSGRSYYFSGFTDNMRRQINASPELDTLLSSVKAFARGARATFGGRVTNFELDQYLEAYPNIQQTAEGRLAVFQTAKLNAELAKREAEITNDLIARYRAATPSNAFGFPPNLREQLAASLETDPKARALFQQYEATTAQLRALRTIRGNKADRQEFNNVLQTYYDARGKQENRFRADDINRISQSFNYLKSNPQFLDTHRYLTLADGSQFVFGRKGRNLTLTRYQRKRGSQ